MFGVLHYSLNSQNSPDELRNPIRKPKWVEDLQQKQPCFDLDAVIMAINCVSSAKSCLERHLHGRRSIVPYSLLWMMTIFSWKLFAVLVASLSTFLCIILQSIHFLLSCVSQLCIYDTLANLFCNTWRIIEIRCCQFLYWPIFLRNCGLRSQSCVEYAEKMALHRHSMWSSLVVDALLGNLFGIALWSQAKPACLLVSNLMDDVTNHLLRTGCVWLMGNPAGFKLNTELAGVLGIVSLDTIQIWSTLWSFMGFLFIPISKIIALFGIVFGLSAAAALIIDMISLITKHVFVLHWSLSLIYSRQIQAIAALWRLFRGRKWNPLRERLDSYDYTVEQHVIGTLLFTPLLLLLPTISSFYTFFTIMNSAISFICVVIEVCIFVIHATPYNKIFLWLVKKRRFPAGIWFEFVTCQHNAVASGTGPVDSIGSVSRKSRKTRESSTRRSTILVSLLHSNYLNLGELVQSNYGDIHSAISRSSFVSSAYGVLTGGRIPSALGTIRSSGLPWFVIPCKQYWYICYEAVLACREN
ncbi:hypothetical protein M9H77_03994 [Catharanthus roseus]|uniref:Uncharacterized protein n=1 Tax=Catharanthus roseus TaxID=4058 RepID=A0ACC0CDB1_CATRO|nr:hypothetical protein M9H77_03994 [Catharanthus roseus]